MRRQRPLGPGRRLGMIAGPLLVLAAAPPAAAKTWCVGFTRAGCDVERSTAADAFTAAESNDRIELGDIEEAAALDDRGRTLDVAGSGDGITVLRGGLTLSAAGSTLASVTVHGLTLAGTASRVRVEGGAVLQGAALLRTAFVRGSAGVDAAAGQPRLETVALESRGGPGLRVRCGATLRARHVTLTGTPSAAVTTDCAQSEARIADSILWGPPEAGFAGPGAVLTDHTNYRAVGGRPDGPGDQHVDPGFVPGSQRLSAGSPLVDAGGPGILAPGEWVEDRDGLPRVADGNGDGTLVRDLGAFELAPPAVPLPAGNLLGDPSAEDGDAWSLSGGFTRERYGDSPFPSAAAGGALGAGDVFFAGGPSGAGSGRQVVDVSGLAPEIDLGEAQATLSGLLGGFRADADSGRLETTYLGPSGRSLGALTLTAPTPAERANATALLPRVRAGAVPALTRAVAVTMEASPATGSYTDAYFDNLGLTVAAPGRSPSPAAAPFAGIRVLRGVARLDRRGRVPVRLACADATVGRCAGALTLTGALARGGTPQRLAVVRVDLAPGAARFVRLPLKPAARRAVRVRRKIRMTLFAAVRDGQGVTRLSTVPLAVKARRRASKAGGGRAPRR